MPFNDTLLPTLQDKIRQAIAPKSPRLAALLLDNNCAVLKTKFNNIDTPENLNTAFAEQINNPLTQNLTDAHLKTYLQGLGFEDKVNSQDNRAVILTQMQTVTLAASLVGLVQEATAYVTTLEQRRQALTQELQSKRQALASAPLPAADETAGIEAAIAAAAANLAELNNKLQIATRMRDALTQQQADLKRVSQQINSDAFAAAGVPAAVAQIPNIQQLTTQLTQLKQTINLDIATAERNIAKVSKRPEANLDTYLTNIADDQEILSFINENNKEMKINFRQLSISNYSEALEILLLGVKGKPMPNQDGKTEPYTIRGLLAKHLWAKETNSSFAQTQREKDKEAVKHRIEACKKLIRHYEQQLAHLNNTTEQAKIILAKVEIEKRKKVLEDYVAGTQAYYNWLLDIIQSHDNQVKATKVLSYTALSKPLDIQMLQGETGQLVQVLKINNYSQTITAGIGNPGNPLTLPTQLQENQMMVVKAQFADSVFAISTTGVHMLQISKSNSMFNVFSILDKSQEQLEWDTLQAMYAYVRDCQGEVPIPIYGNDERTVTALYAAALAMGKEVKVLYGYTIPAQGSKEDQLLQQTVENMKIKLSQLGALEANQLESDPAVVKTQFVPPAA